MIIRNQGLGPIRAIPESCIEGALGVFSVATSAAQRSTWLKFTFLQSHYLGCQFLYFESIFLNGVMKMFKLLAIGCIYGAEAVAKMSPEVHGRDEKGLRSQAVFSRQGARNVDWALQYPLGKVEMLLPHVYPGISLARPSP